MATAITKAPGCRGLYILKCFITFLEERVKIHLRISGKHTFPLTHVVCKNGKSLQSRKVSQLDKLTVVNSRTRKTAHIGLFFLAKNVNKMFTIQHARVAQLVRALH